MSTLKVNNVQDLGADAVVTNGVIEKLALPSGSILQVAQAVKSDTFTTTSATGVDVTGLSVAITPTSTTSKILIIAQVNFGQSSGGLSGVSLVRDSTYIYGGNSTASAASFLDTAVSGGDRLVSNPTLVFLDSPSSTSALTYKVGLMSDGTRTAIINRRGIGGAGETTESTITVMEVAA